MSLLRSPGEVTGGRRIAVLDGYRALAILLVLAFHYTVRFAPPLQRHAHFPAGSIFSGAAPLDYGWAGVELFFVISGFVILMTLERCRSVGEFALRRFARLWPMLVIAASMTSLVVYLIGPPDWRVSWPDYLMSILLIEPSLLSHFWAGASFKWVDDAYWSLFVEIRFYALAAVVYLAAGRNFVRYWLVLQGVAFAAFLVVVLTAFRAYPYLSLVLFPDYMPYFTVGICVYECYSRGPLNKIAAAGAVMAAGMALFNAYYGLFFAIGGTPHGNAVVNLLIFSLFLLFVIDHPIVRIFASRPMVRLGQASYSLYLIHQVIGVCIMRVCIGLGVPYLIVLPVTVCAMIASACLLFYRVEVPIKSWILCCCESKVALFERRLPWLSYTTSGG
ncbi:MAG: acyltransferase [Alphaproteobacteria bacterium]|nr:acyltransferase [Alphaproteobacteria bacterium]